MSILSDVFDMASDYSAQALAAGPTPEMAPADPAIVDRAVVAGMSLEGMSGFQPGHGMQPHPELAQSLAIRMPHTVADMQARLETPSGPGFGSQFS